jgi:hypothetical protein
MAKPRMEGTQRPMKMDASFSPMNHIVSEEIRDKKARNNIITSTLLSFWNIMLFFNIITLHFVNCSISENSG